MTELRIGIHADDRSLMALRRCGVLEELLAERGAEATWVEYDDSRRTIDLLSAGELHIAGTGITPPLRAQSEGVEIVYCAVSALRETRGTISVRAGSSIARVADLRGRRIAVARGSGPTQLLVTILDRSGIAHRQLDVALLPAAAGRRALLDGEVDAWLDHELPATPPRWRTDDDAELRQLPSAAAVVADRNVWFARRDVATERPDLVETVVVALRRPPFAAEAISRDFVIEQQRVADLLAAHGVLALPVNVAGAVAPLFIYS